MKQAETSAFEEILIILDDISDSPEFDWDYHMSFDGFKKYLGEKAIQDYRLIIDKEGKKKEESKTLKTAHEVGLNEASEADSTEYPGIRAFLSARVALPLVLALKDLLNDGVLIPNFILKHPFSRMSFNI